MAETDVLAGPDSLDHLSQIIVVATLPRRIVLAEGAAKRRYQADTIVTVVSVQGGTSVQGAAHSSNVSESDGTLIVRYFQGFLDDRSYLTPQAGQIQYPIWCRASLYWTQIGMKKSETYAENDDCVYVLGTSELA
jgi:hypothetical protein